MRSVVCCAGDESSVGRSVDSLFWRAGVIRLFPSPFPPYATRPAQDPRGKNKSACVSWMHRGSCGQLLSGSGSAGAIPILASAIRDRHRRGCTIARRTLRYVPRYLQYHSIYPRRGSGYMGRYLLHLLELTASNRPSTVTIGLEQSTYCLYRGGEARPLGFRSLISANL